MVLAASKERSRLTQGSPPGVLSLRVIGSARDGQIVRLTAAKCAIGSAEGCTLRLRARGVRPVHCLVLRGTHGTVARSWAPNTQLNGEPFRDAVLEPGDRLSIGPVEFEVLESEGPPTNPTDAGRTVVFDRRPADRSLRTDSAKTIAGRSAKQPTRWRSHVRKLVKEVRKLRSQIDDFQSAAQLVPPAATSDTDEIREKLENYQQQNEQWESTLQGLQAELDSRERQLASELADLGAARQTLDTQRQEWRLESDAGRNDLVERERLHRQAAEALQAAQIAFEAERGQHDVGLQAARQQLNQRETELDSLARQHAEAGRRVEEIERRAAELEQRARTLDERESELTANQGAAGGAAAELAACRTKFEAQQQAAQSQLDEQRAALDARQRAHGETLAAHESRQGELQAAHETLAQRQLELEQSAVSLSNERNTLLAEHQTRQTELDCHAQELDRRAAELAERESPFNERVSQEAELRQANEELQRRVAELAEREAQLAAEPASAVEPLVDPALAGELTEREARLAELQAELEQERDNLSEDRQEFDKTRLRSAERLDAEAKELERERQALAAEREAFEAQRRLDFDRREVDQAVEEEAEKSREEQVHAAASGASDEVDDDEDVESEDETPALHEFAPSQPVQRRQSTLDTARGDAGDTVRATPHGDDDVSIEQYMAALLNRSRTGQASPVIQPMEHSRRNKRKSDVQPPAEVEKNEGADITSFEVPVLDMPPLLVQLERRKQTEVRPDMNVLREIGITHARSAIATHGQQRSLRQAYGTLATSLVCFLAAFLVFYFGTHTVFHLTGMAIVVIGIYWLGTSIWAVNKVLTSMKQRRGGLRATLAEIDAEIEALKKEAEAELEEVK